MGTDFTFALSLAAMDLLWEQFQLGLPPTVFELPSVGETMDDRARLREVVYGDLTSRNLAHRGRLVPEVEESLRTLARFGRAIEGVVLVPGEPPLTFRAAAGPRLAVLAQKRDQVVRFDVLRPEGMVHATLGLIGQERAGRGKSVSYPDPDPDSGEAARPKPTPTRQFRPVRGDDEEFAGFTQQVQASGGNYEAQRRAAQAVLEQPRVRSGWFTVLGRDRTGRELPASYLSWFDTEDGRYLAHRRPGPDGQQWATCTPADTARIAQQLAGLLSALNAAGQ